MEAQVPTAEMSEDSQRPILTSSLPASQHHSLSSLWYAEPTFNQVTVLSPQK